MSDYELLAHELLALDPELKHAFFCGCSSYLAAVRRAFRILGNERSPNVHFGVIGGKMSGHPVTGTFIVESPFLELPTKQQSDEFDEWVARHAETRLHPGSKLEIRNDIRREL